MKKISFIILLSLITSASTFAQTASGNAANYCVDVQQKVDAEKAKLEKLGSAGQSLDSIREQISHLSNEAASSDLGVDLSMASSMLGAAVTMGVYVGDAASQVFFWSRMNPLTKTRLMSAGGVIFVAGIVVGIYEHHEWAIAEKDLLPLREKLAKAEASIQDELQNESEAAREMGCIINTK